jgi:hypothetical protein
MIPENDRLLDGPELKQIAGIAFGVSAVAVALCVIGHFKGKVWNKLGKQLPADGRKFETPI